MKSCITTTALRPPSRINPGFFLMFMLALIQFCWLGQAAGQVPIPPSTQFDFTGFLQEATLTSPGDAHSGGTLKVNGHTVVVPQETIVIYPANALTWQELFAKAPAPWGIPGITPGAAGFNGGVGGPTTGMAMADCAVAPAATGCTASPLTTYEVHVVGNRVGDTYIAGLINISQQDLNSGGGYINFIDYGAGEMRVGGVLGDATTGARVRINDPVGRYGLATTSPDVRFTVDPDNPTIMAGTGYPMCLPRGSVADPLCPQGNRPLDGLGNFVASFTTNNASNPAFPIVPGFPDSHFQAPFEVGDYVTFAGTLVKDEPAGGFAAGDGPTVGPMPASGAAATYVSAHTITNNVAIYTWPGSDPAYIMTEVTIIGTGGLTVAGAGEAAIRTRFEGMMTDPSRSVHLYGIDLNPDGSTVDRDWGTIGVDPGPPLGAVKGRWRFRPPCAPFGTDPATIKFDKQCIGNAAGTFLPPTREMRSVIEGQQTQVAALAAGDLTKSAANGIFYGQYHAPILEYIFPENVPGTPIVENNFNAIPFLVCGGYSSSGIGIPPTAPTLAGVLNPWPSNVPPNTSACAGFVAAPSAAAATASPNSVISGTGAAVTLSATASGTAPLTFVWTQAATDAVQVLPAGGVTGATATFTTPVVAVNTTLNFTITVTNSAGSSTASVTVPVSVDQPIVNHVAPQTVISGTPVTMNIGGNDPGGLPLIFTVTQTGGPAPNVAPLVVTQVPPSSATATFTYALPLGAPAATLDFSIVATNSAGVSSATDFTTVTVNPIPDSLVVTSAEYRTGKARLTLTATSSVVSPQVSLFLQPYACNVVQPAGVLPCPGGIFDPTTLGNVFANNGGGLYTIVLVGAPEPAVPPATPLTVRSNLGGLSAPSTLTRVRQ